VSQVRAQDLNFLWHSVLPIVSLGWLSRYVAYGAEFKGQWYAVAIWTDPIAANRLTDGAKLLELRRFAIAPDAPKNTASRMLGIMRRKLKVKFPDVIRLISYQAEEHHVGTIYKASGWSPVARSEYQEWHPGASRAEPQTKSDKVRWEIDLNA